jgi:hypothetical protein
VTAYPEPEHAVLEIDAYDTKVDTNAGRPVPADFLEMKRWMSRVGL